MLPLGESVPPRQQKEKIPPPHSSTSCWAELRAWASFVGMENSVTKHTWHVHTGGAQAPPLPVHMLPSGHRAWAYAGNGDGITHIVLGKWRDRSRIAIEGCRPELLPTAGGTHLTQSGSVSERTVFQRKRGWKPYCNRGSTCLAFQVLL